MSNNTLKFLAVIQSPIRITGKIFGIIITIFGFYCVVMNSWALIDPVGFYKDDSTDNGPPSQEEEIQNLLGNGAILIVGLGLILITRKKAQSNKHKNSS